LPIDDPGTSPAVEGFATGANETVAGRLLRLNRSTGLLETYFATTGQTWMTVSSGPGAPDQIMPPGEGLFVHDYNPDPGGTDISFSILQFGEARTTQVAVPLKSGYNLIGSAHPVVGQTMDGTTTPSASRLLNTDTAGGKFASVGSVARSRADQLQPWIDDSEVTDASIHECYGQVYFRVSSNGDERWVDGGVVGAASRSDEANFFQSDRSMLYCIYNRDLLDYYIPSPISN